MLSPVFKQADILVSSSGAIALFINARLKIIETARTELLAGPEWNQPREI
jgi:hypothetical protein